MFNRIFRIKKTEITAITEISQYKISKSGKDLLLPGGRANLVRKIKRLFSVTEDVWNNHYLYSIERFAELVQEVPASEMHHHSSEGGLIDHTLEALHAGVRISQGYILPPNSEPEKISASSDRWRFGAFIAILAHDLGKIVTDIEVVYKIKGGEFQQWHPWYGDIPFGAEYKYRYRKRIENSKVAKSIHEKASISLLPKIITEKAARWIFEDGELLGQLFSTITHSTFGGQAIAEIVRAADGSSVSKNLGAETGTKREHTASIPLHEKLIVSLRKLINDGDLIKNRPGAAIWVTEKDTWIVSKATMDSVKNQLVNEGHTGIPKNTVRLFEVLREHDLLIPTPAGDSVWMAEINDFAKNWQQKLTFLRFKNEIIWPTSNPDLFDGEVTPIDRKGKPIELEEAAVES
jgi:integrating conjugative element relaxase (TIGR03760 family)